MLAAENAVVPVNHSLYPELRLWAAVLELAITDFLHGRANDQREATRWIFADRDESQLNTFLNLCYTLDLDPDAVKERLKRMRGH